MEASPQRSTESLRPNWVVRGGLSVPIHLMEGYKEHLGAPGIFGFSVQYQPGYTVDRLAVLGRIRHARISYADRDELIDGARKLGYLLEVVPTPGNGFHHTVAVKALSTGVIISVLPIDLAVALSTIFIQVRNPYQVE